MGEYVEVCQTYSCRLLNKRQEFLRLFVWCEWNLGKSDLAVVDLQLTWNYIGQERGICLPGVHTKHKFHSPGHQGRYYPAT